MLDTAEAHTDISKNCGAGGAVACGSLWIYRIILIFEGKSFTVNDSWKTGTDELHKMLGFLQWGVMSGLYCYYSNIFQYSNSLPWVAFTVCFE